PQDTDNKVIAKVTSTVCIGQTYHLSHIHSHPSPSCNLTNHLRQADIGAKPFTIHLPAIPVTNSHEIDTSPAPLN
ncbi:hypothetical protein JTE90_022537, partial [Oedothorax gibbosus]